MKFNHLSGLFALALAAAFSPLAALAAAPATVGSYTEEATGNIKAGIGVDLLTPITISGGDASAANQVITNADLGPTNATVCATDTGTCSLNALIKKINQGLTAIAAAQTAATQKTMVVDGSGNVIASTSNNLNVQCANCSGSGVSAADEASFTYGTSLFASSGGFFQTTATSNALTNGQQGAFQLTSTRALFSNLRNAAGTEVGTSTTPLQVTLANTGANATAVKVDGSAVTQPVSVASIPSHAVTNAGTFATQSAVTAASGSVASGAIASGAYASGSIGSGAVASGAYASGAFASGAFASGSISDGANVTLGAKADAKSTATDTTSITIMQVLKQISASVQAPPAQSVTNGGTFVVQNAQGDDTQANAIRGAITTAMTSTTSTSLVAAPGAALYNYILSISCVNSHATVGTNVIIQDGSGGTTLLNLAAASLFGGTARTFPFPGLKQPTSNTALYAADVTTGASVTCDAEGYKGS